MIHTMRIIKQKVTRQHDPILKMHMQRKEVEFISTMIFFDKLLDDLYFLLFCLSVVSISSTTKCVSTLRKNTFNKIIVLL